MKIEDNDGVREGKKNYLDGYPSRIEVFILDILGMTVLVGVAAGIVAVIAWILRLW